MAAMIQRRTSPLVGHVADCVKFLTPSADDANEMTHQALWIEGQKL